MYEYLPIEQAKVGDIVEAIDSENNVTAGKLYVILPGSKNNSIGHFINDLGKPSDGINLCKYYWKLLATKPGNHSKVGDTVFCIKDTTRSCKQGKFFIVHDIDENYLSPPPGILFNGLISQEGWAWSKKYFVVLCKKEQIFTSQCKEIFLNGCPETIPDFNSTKYKEDQAFLASLDYTEKINQTQKENSMNSLQQLLCQIFGAEKPTTDYDNRKHLMVIVYSLDGKMVATATADSVEQVASEVKRSPQLWGCKVLTYKLNKELFVDVPVSIEKARIASAVEQEAE